MKILNIKLKTKTNANVFVVETDAGEFLLHSDEIVKCGINKGEVENQTFYKAVENSQVLIAFNLSTKYLSGKLKTEKQIKDYLYKKEFNQQTINKVVEKLKEYHIIDDKIFAETYKKNNANFSANKLKQKLMIAGVNKETIESELEDVDDTSSCLNHANKFLRNKVMDKPTVEKLVRRLTYLGYRWETIKSVLNQLKFEIED